MSYVIMPAPRKAKRGGALVVRMPLERKGGGVVSTLRKFYQKHKPKAQQLVALTDPYLAKTKYGPAIIQARKAALGYGAKPKKRRAPRKGGLLNPAGRRRGGAIIPVRLA